MWKKQKEGKKEGEEKAGKTEENTKNREEFGTGETETTEVEFKESEGSHLGFQDEKTTKLFDNRIKFEWLTTEEAAEYLRISAKYLLNLTSNGRVRYFKFGRRNRFLLSDLKSLLLAQARGGSYGY